MITNIIDAIAENIDDSYVFSEKVHQGYDENCYIVSLISGKHVTHIKNSYINYYEFKITYYCTESFDTYANLIFDAISTISNVKVIDSSFEVFKDRLEYTLNLREFVLYKEETTSMQSLYFK